ncbi:MAG: hypothetical protein JWQ18_2213, partial [Conexibacter sp.]|nr:hypothetical protein [Conexibacter sp.]
GALGDVRLVGPRQMVAMATVESAALRDAVMLEPGRFTAGFEKATSGLTSLSGVPGALLFSDEAFGHSGFGGSIGFADPGGRFSFGYTLNRHVEHVPGGVDRYQRLIDATYRALGYGGRETGRWRPGAAA